VNVNEFAEKEKLFDGFDEERQVRILDDDKVCDALEEVMKPGGVVLDTHSMVDYFPERWFDLVIVLTTDNTLLYDRLVKRGYVEAKVRENVQSEIMMVIQEEAKSAYAKEIVQILPSNTVEQLESNVQRIGQWAQAWLKSKSG